MSYRPVFGKPRLTQDWGTEQHERETHWTSLFYDLMLVAALNALAEPFEEFNEGDVDLDSGDTTSSYAKINTKILEPIKYLWLDAALQFFSVVNPWNSLNEYTSMFEDESLVGHMVFFVHCFGIATTAAGCVGEFSENYKDLATGIVFARVGLLVLWARPIFYIQRVRVQGLLRCVCHVVTIGMILWGAASVEGEDERDAFHRFRMVMVVSVVWEWLSVLLSGAALSKEHRVPLHIMSFADRFKEITMVIFGEAVFAIVLRPLCDASDDTNYYLLLLSTIWLIYSLALQEFHVMPSEEDHAMRRSIVFGSLWYSTQIFKELFLLGLSIGIKRAHLLSFVSPSDPIDKDTLNLLVWGFALTILMVALIRSYSFGFGRHPSKDDPPDIYRLKVAWWVVLSATCLIPLLLKRTLFHTFDTPLAVVFIFGCMMTFIILTEAFTSNLVAERVKKRLLTETNANEKEVNELTYLGSAFSDTARGLESADFLCCHGPKSTKE